MTFKMLINLDYRVLSWGLINLGCWAAIHFHIRDRQTLQSPPKQMQKMHHHVLKMLLINVVFDALYVVTGCSLVWLDFIPEVLRLPFHWAIIIQGLVLFLLDSYFSWHHWQCERSV